MKYLTAEEVVSKLYEIMLNTSVGAGIRPDYPPLGASYQYLLRVSHKTRHAIDPRVVESYHKMKVGEQVMWDGWAIQLFLDTAE